MFVFFSLVLVAVLPPLFAAFPERIVPAVTVATFPAGTFLENVTIGADGAPYVTSLNEGAIYRLGGAHPRQFARIDGKLAGILRDGSGFVADGWDAHGTAIVVRIAAHGQVTRLARLPDVSFPNGMTWLDRRTVLVADAAGGRIVAVDTRNGAVHTLLRDPLLGRSDPRATFPAVNGIRRNGTTLWISNTQRRLLLRADLSGGTAARLRVIAKGLNLDDFAVAADGSLIATTHVFDRVVRIRPDGSVTVIAGAAQGVIGCTSAAFGRTAADRDAVYVTTNGGMTLPPPGGVRRARVVRLRVGITGAAMP